MAGGGGGGGGGGLLVYIKKLKQQDSWEIKEGSKKSCRTNLLPRVFYSLHRPGNEVVV